jgi:hypothetical protein
LPAADWTIRMSKPGKRATAKSLTASERPAKSGIYPVVRPREGGAVKEAVSGAGKPLPPLPKSAERYTIRTKSGGYIITSPVESDNTVTTWSKAFKRK